MPKRLPRRKESLTTNMMEPIELPFIAKEDLARAKWNVLYKEIGETEKVSHFVKGLRSRLKIPLSLDLDQTLKYASSKCKDGVGVDENGKIFVK